jgi:hypothetical protein
VLSSSSPIYADYKNMKVTVNQTQNLTNQTLSVTWSGAPPTLSDNGGLSPFAVGGTFGADFLQIMQCWSAPGAAGPTPQQCEFGGHLPDTGGSQPYPRLVGGSTSNEVASRELDLAYPQGTTSVPGLVTDAGGQGLWMPFTGVDGSAVAASADPTRRDPTTNQSLWLNQDFNSVTTNEDDFGLTRPDGSGSEYFTVDTGLESPALGCGQTSYQPSHGSAETPQCWLVIVPRGTPQQEDQPYEIGGSGQVPGVLTSALSPMAWADRISVPLAFTPVGDTCPIGANEQRIVGSELALPAVLSWEPVLCANRSEPPYNFAAQSDDEARQELTAGTVGVVGAPGMAIMSRPLNAFTLGSGTSVTYAPLTLSGLVIAFNIQRTQISQTLGDPAEQPLLGTRVTQLNLTPLLVAKLLSQSYQNQFPLLNQSGELKTSQYQWLAHNPDSIFADPDFLRYNPEFADLATDFYNGSGRQPPVGLIVEQPNSDAAFQLWTWVLSDPQAAAWLSGNADPCTSWKPNPCPGSRVNPVYLTTAQNPSGSPFATPVPDGYPDNDPYCANYLAAPAALNGQTVYPPPRCMLDMSPYANTMQAVAQEVRAGNDGAKMNPGAVFNPVFPDLFWQSSGPQAPGENIAVGVTDSASAAAFGLQTASLSAAGDDNNPTFVAPSSTSLEAGVAEMSAGPSGLLQSSVNSVGSYPLTLLTYAAVLPSTLGTTAREAYANFINYAVGAGQTPGLAAGDLPPGYAPLPTALRAQAVAAEKAILTAPAANSSSSGSGPPGSASGGSGNGGAAGSSTTSGANAGQSPAAGANNNQTANSLSNGRQTATPITYSPARGRTPSTATLILRYALPVALGVGLAAAVIANWLGLKRPGGRRRGRWLQW